MLFKDIPLINYAESVGIECRLSSTGREVILEFPSGVKTRMSIASAERVQWPVAYLAKVFNSITKEFTP